MQSFLSTDRPIRDSVLFGDDLIWVALYATLDPNTSAIEELKSSGGLSLTRNPDFRTSILKYYNVIENVSEFDLIHWAYFVEQYGRLGPKIVDGFVLTERFMAISKDLSSQHLSFPVKYIDAEHIKSTGYLRELLESTGGHF